MLKNLLPNKVVILQTMLNSNHLKLLLKNPEILQDFLLLFSR